MKAKAHKFITKSVLTVIEKLNFSDREIKWICRGSSLEDWWTPIQRIKNWHFYRSNNEMKEKEAYLIGKSRTSSEKRLKYLICKLDICNFNITRHIVLGRIIHHIQDMSTPSHVTPIYHGPLKRDSYETYMMRYIQYYDDKDFLASINQIDNPDSFFNLYEYFAKKSLNTLKTQKVPLVDKTSADIGFDMIWTPFPKALGKYVGFGKFGKYGNCFNGEPLKDGTLIDINAIYKFFTMQAAQSTYEALLHFQNNYKGN